MLLLKTLLFSSGLFVKTDTIANTAVYSPRSQNAAQVRNQTPLATQALLQLSRETKNKQQTHDCLDSLYRDADVARAELSTIFDKLALLLPQCNLLVAPNKARARAQIKVRDELNHRADLLTDLVRASVVSLYPQDLLKAFYLLEQEIDIVELTNRFATPAPSGYRDMKMLVRLAKSQMVVEVQFHLDAVYQLKNGADHERYEEIQGIERLAQQQLRELNHQEQAHIARLRARSQWEYQQAWKPYQLAS